MAVIEYGTPFLPDLELIAYVRGKFDTHGGYEDGAYTFVVSGHYFILGADGVCRKFTVKAGDTVENPTWVVYAGRA